MATKKLKYFEYAGHAENTVKSGSGAHVHSAFDTPNGFAFVIVGNNIQSDQEDAFCHVAAERLKYYLMHEELEDPAEAVRNAMIYTNGFVYVSLEKQAKQDPGELSCLCVLFKEGKVYYSWVGQVSLYLYAASKLTALTWDVFADHLEETSQMPWKMAFLGQAQTVTPGVCQQPYLPVNDDMLLMGTSGLYLDPDEKEIKKVLADSMPTHTKAIRLLKQANDDIPAACQLIRFYNLDQEKRSFLPGNQTNILRNDPVNELGAEEAPSGTRKNIVAMVLTGLAVCLLFYMVYDLFLFNPRPSKRISQEPELSIAVDTAPVDTAKADVKTSGETNSRAAATVSLPEDIIYLVKTGDTWGKIYREFEVCSWFIRNHEANQGKFNQANNPVAGSRIAIPVMYSAKPRLNPNFYAEFTVQKTGTSCQQANAAFITSFREKIGLANE